MTKAMDEAADHEEDVYAPGAFAEQRDVLDDHRRVAIASRTWALSGLSAEVGMAVIGRSLFAWSRWAVRCLSKAAANRFAAGAELDAWAVGTTKSAAGLPVTSRPVGDARRWSLPASRVSRDESYSLNSAGTLRRADEILRSLSLIPFLFFWSRCGAVSSASCLLSASLCRYGPRRRTCRWTSRPRRSARWCWASSASRAGRSPSRCCSSAWLVPPNTLTASCRGRCSPTACLCRRVVWLSTILAWSVIARRSTWECSAKRSTAGCSPGSPARRYCRSASTTPSAAWAPCSA